MPWTFSHPLAVVPLRSLCPRWLNFPALIVGSLSPDFGYYIGGFEMATFAHSIQGTVMVCWPTGLLALAIFAWLSRPLCFMLPEPHRSALTPPDSAPRGLSIRSIFIAAISILLGAWTHTVWDSCTHASGWTVHHVAILQTPLQVSAHTSLPLYYFLQQVSTFAAAAILVFLYFRWLRRRAAPTPPEIASFPDKWRYTILFAIAAVSCAVAAVPALQQAARFDGYTAFRVFLFRMGVYGATIFAALFIVSALVLYAAHLKRDRRNH